jgi:tetratricopeptide (TPR) repeat protein
MKKFVLLLILCLLFSTNLPTFASEIEEDYLDIAANYCVIGNYQGAIEYLNKILEINPANTQANDLKKGLQHVISQDKKSFVANVNPYIKQAMEEKRVGNISNEYKNLIKGTESENSYLAYYYLGNYYRDNNNYIKALDAYNNALSAKPNFAQAYLASAITLFEVGKFDAVLNPIDKYLTFEPNDDLAYAIKSRAEFQLGMIENSEQDNNTAIEINNCPEYQFDKAKILYKNEKYADSKETFKKLLPYIQTSKIYEYMGLCDLALKDYTNALMNIDKALILSDDDEYLENKYNEIKSLLEDTQNDKTTD